MYTHQDRTNVHSPGQDKCTLTRTGQTYTHQDRTNVHSPGQDKEEPVDDVPQNLKGKRADKGVGLEAVVIATELRMVNQDFWHRVSAHVARTGEVGTIVGDS